MIGWVYLLLAIVFEVTGTTAMKMSEGFTKIIPSAIMIIFYMLSLTALTLALKKFDVSMAYAIWSGVGTALIALIGFYFFKEEMNIVKILSIGFIILGVIGLHLSGEYS
ncbi:MAG: multidrug efflux SMR transporter [Sulfurovum sp.]|nr:multidrug efflux SMR transporter [Sulfurovum sp.]MCB4761993.1 multidrug efflux SMR transporter [Sulfurovum sp.]MCB4763259.1 multidrug efflux SMR transporter [Sulfurovum sp.]MCB4773347.1 multidrug efflux SMR transporter [Sulfurovum sp.]MCB4778988.1 multidrug efflux SMR transporter [Sulfurovum sp.]